jgi:GT2 family glycosyltransferase
MTTLSVVIPTRDRPAALRHTLARLSAQAPVPGGAEVIVVENGPAGEAARLVAEVPAADGLTVRLLHEPTPGPALARNRGIEAAGGDLLLLLGDDTAPIGADLLGGHVHAHAAHASGRAAVLGRIAWPAGEVSPLMRWLDHGGIQFAFDNLPRGPVPIERHFYSSHVSIPTALLRELGGFDTRFTHAAMEDIELGWRLAQRGAELIYHPELVVEHDHPTSYSQSIERMARVGAGAAQLMAIHPDAGAVGIGPTAVYKAPAMRLAGGLLLRRHELAMLPAPLRELRWRIVHLDAFYRGARRAR